MRGPQVVASKERPAGERFGRYTLLEPIGRGGMAEVFRAVAHGVEGFQRVFVIKRILKEKSQSQDFIDMFVSEARVSALLNHPNIVQSYDFGQISGSYFISMEYLRGKDLLLLMRQLRAARKSLNPAVAAYIAQQVATGLHYAHSLTGAQGKPLNIVHRDVSPSNIMLLRAGGVKLLDFGIAKVGESKRVEADNKSQDAFIKGKLSYLSPEQIRGDNIDARSDVFSLGVCLWEMLTGRRLFFDKNEYTIMKNVLDRPVIPPSMQRMDSPTALDYIVVRALERDVSRRYRSAKEMADELEGFLAQSHFSPSSLPRVLDDLFGVDAGIFDAQMETQIQALASWGELHAVEGSSVAEAASSPLKTVPPLAVDGTGPKAPRREARSRGRHVAWLLAGILMAGAAAVAADRLKPHQAVDQAAPRDLQPTPAVAPPPSEPVVGEAPAEGSPAFVATAPAPLPATIDLRLETQPTKAEIVASDGRLLGATPANLSLPRSNQPVTLTLRRKGFANLVHTVVPDRDAQVVLSLYRQRAKRATGSETAPTVLQPTPAAAAKSEPQAPEAQAPAAAPAEAPPAPPAEAPQPPPAEVIEPLLPASP